MIKKLVVSASVVAAAFAVAGLAEKGLYLASAGCIGWMVFVIVANIVKPRAATRGRKETLRTKSFRLYNLTEDARFQERIRILKAKEDAR